MTITLPASDAALHFLGPENASALLELQDAATRGLPPRFFMAKDAAGLRPYLDGTRGVAYGIAARGVLRAAGLLRLPSTAYPNAAANPPFPVVPPAEWPGHAAFLENAMVHPDQRGRGWQRALLDARLARAAECGMRWACSAAHLGNQVSWTNLIQRGMAIVGLIEREGQPIVGLLYPIGASHLASDPQDCRIVPAQDQAQHLAALADGYIGVRLAGNVVIYRRRLR